MVSFFYNSMSFLIFQSLFFHIDSLLLLYRQITIKLSQQNIEARIWPSLPEFYWPISRLASALKNNRRKANKLKGSSKQRQHKYKKQENTIISPSRSRRNQNFGWHNKIKDTSCVFWYQRSFIFAKAYDNNNNFQQQMTQRMHTALMQRTRSSLKTLKMIAQVLKQIKDRVPTQLFAQCISNQEASFKLKIQSMGCPLQKNFQEILKGMKNNNLDMVKQIENSRKSLQQYYETKQQLQVLTEQHPRKNNLRSRIKVKKNKGIKKQRTKDHKEHNAKEQIYQSEQQEVEDFLV